MSLASTNNNSNSDRFLKAFYPPGFQKIMTTRQTGGLLAPIRGQLPASA